MRPFRFRTVEHDSYPPRRLCPCSGMSPWWSIEVIEVIEEVLTAKNTGHFVVTGAQFDACIRSTIHGGFARGYDVTLASDAHTTEDLSDWGAPPPDMVVSHTNLYWGFESGPGRTARAQESAEVDFVAPRTDS